MGGKYDGIAPMSNMEAMHKEIKNSVKILRRWALIPYPR